MRLPDPPVGWAGLLTIRAAVAIDLGQHADAHRDQATRELEPGVVRVFSVDSAFSRSSKGKSLSDRRTNGMNARIDVITPLGSTAWRRRGSFTRAASALMSS